MKKQFLALLLALLLLASLAPAALAEDGVPTMIFDLSGILDDEAYDMLEQVAEDIAAQYDFYPYIVSLDDYREYVSDEDTDEMAKDVYLGNELGYGDEQRGCILLLCMDDGFFDIYSQGDARFDTAALDALGDDFKAGLEADWTDGFAAYLRGCEALLNSETRTTESAAGETGQYVYDTAMLLTLEEQAALQARAEEIAATYDFGVYVFTCDDYMLYSSRSVEYAAEVIYKTFDMGVGEEKSGIMLLLSMDDRDYDLCAYGYGHVAFTDYGKRDLATYFLDNFKRNDWYNGFRDYQARCVDLLQQAKEGHPLDVSNGGGGSSRGGGGGRYEPGTAIAIGLFVGVLVALIVTLIMRGKMRSVRKATGARNYAIPDSLVMTDASDHFTHITETRVKVESERSSGGGGGTSVSSGGFSHSSGKF